MEVIRLQLYLCCIHGKKSGKIFLSGKNQGIIREFHFWISVATLCITFQKFNPSFCFKCFKIRILKWTIRRISSAISTTFLHVGICVCFLVKNYYEFGHFPKKRIHGKTMKLPTTFKHQHLASLITLALNFDQVISLFQLRNFWIRRYMKCDTSYTTNWFYIKHLII